MTRREIRDCTFKLIFEKLLREEDSLEELYATAKEIEDTYIIGKPKMVAEYIIANKENELRAIEENKRADLENAVKGLEEILNSDIKNKNSKLSDYMTINIKILSEVIGHFILREMQEIYVNEKVKSMTEEVSAHTEELDGIIKNFSLTREFNRIAKINIAVLRIALYEIIYDNKKTPINAAISEAVLVSQTYSQPEDTAFVNGILGAYARSLKVEEDKEEIAENV